MSAVIIAFPVKPVNEASLAIVGGALREAIPLANKDAELQLLVQIADQLIDNIGDYAIPYCHDLMFDDFIARLDKWDNRRA